MREKRGVSFGVWNYGPVAGGGAAGKSHGKIFLDSNLDLQIKIKADIGNAKPTLSNGLTHQIFSGQYGMGQMAGVFLPIRKVEVAMSADCRAFREWFHAVNAIPLLF